jgi:hypothetical protein
VAKFAVAQVGNAALLSRDKAKTPIVMPGFPAPRLALKA